MKQIGIYHRADLDGLCCAAIMRLRYPDTELIGWDYGDEPADFFRGIAERATSGNGPDLSECEVIMADVSMSFYAMLSIAQRAEGFLWVDHHAKAIKELEPIFAGHSTAHMVGETGKAACELLWDAFFPEKPIPLIVQCLGVYDTWRKKNEYLLNWQHDILPVQMYFNVHFDIEKLCAEIKWDKKAFSLIKHKGLVMMDYDRAQIRRAMYAGAIVDEWPPLPISRIKDAEMYLRHCFALNACAVNPGRLADEVWTVYPDIEIVITYYQKPDGRWKYSLRSQDDGPNVAKIAGQYGGGGHPNAAGFISEELLF